MQTQLTHIPVRRRARRGHALAALLALSVLAACGGDSDGREGESPSTSAVTVYWVDGDGKLRPVEQEVDGVERMRPEGRAVAAVEALVRTKPDGDGLTSHWAERCATGAKVQSLEQQGTTVTVEVHGVVGVICKKTGAELTQQRQQLAWTVVDNLDAEPSTRVRFLDYNGLAVWDDVVPDEKALAD